MPTIVYCDYTSGNDTTGDGTNGDPWKTITKASIGLSGGDEVRVAKSPANTALTGTLGFTINGTALVGTNTLFESELVIGDFVLGGDGHYWEVVTITNDTAAVLHKKYSGSTGAGITAYKLGVTSTGEAAATSTQIQVVSASGTSVASRLKISGGWDLTGPTQDGQTYFRQMHGTFNNRYGRGLYSSGKDYIEIERLHFMRYDNGFYADGADGWLITGMNCIGAGDEAFYMSNSTNDELVSCIASQSNDRGLYLSTIKRFIITSPICDSNENYGIYMTQGMNNTIIAPTCKSNKGYAIAMSSSNNNIIITPTFNNNEYGVYFLSSHNNTIVAPILNDNSVYGIYSVSSYLNVCHALTGTGNGEDIFVSTPGSYGKIASLGVQHFKAAGDNRQYFEFGVTYRDTADARSGACFKFDPSNATYYIRQSFFCPVSSGVERTVKIYMKDDAGFDGDVVAALFFLGEKITGWTTWTMTTSYVEQDIVGASGAITEDGVIELRVKVRGTAGNVFADDFSYS